MPGSAQRTDAANGVQPTPPGSDRDAARAGDGEKNPALPRNLTEAGETADYFADVKRDLDEGVGRRATAAAPAKPSKGQIRTAEREALLGVRLAREGKLAEAIAHLRNSVALDPEAANAQHELGVACLKAGQAEAAAIAFAAAVRLKPDFAGARKNLAAALDRLGRTHQALGLYKEAVRQEPGWHLGQLRLGQIYLGQNRGAEAAAAFRAAAAAAGAASVQGRILLASAADAAGDSALAMEILRAVILAAPDHGLAHVLLGQMVAQAGDSAEATALIERGIALDPSLVSAWYPLVMTRTFAAADQALIGRIAASLERPGLGPRDRMALCFALGKAHDDVGEYAQAMRHFEAANRIRSATMLDRAAVLRRTKETIAATPAGYLARRPGLGVADETPILIVGMPRSGTTLVEQILARHPDVAAGGELTFWQDHSRAGLGLLAAEADPAAVRRLGEEYLALLRSISPEAARVTDKRVFNFAELGIIRQALPRASIVHCRRHPLDTCLSIFCMHFEATMAFAGERGSLVFFYRQYQILMAHWREVLPPDRFIEIDYEELVADPEPTTRRLLAACGLAWNDACLAPHLNRRRIMTASLWQARQPIYRTSVERWKHYEPWLGELKALLPAAAAK